MTKLLFAPQFHSLCTDGPLAGSWVLSAQAGFQGGERAVLVEAVRIIADGGSLGYVDCKSDRMPPAVKPPLLLPFNPSPSPSPPRPFPVMVDEYGYYFGQSDDTLKEELRNIDGIPNATYLVDDNRVFVFEKLLHLVKSTAGVLELKGEARRRAVLGLLAQAWVSPTEAVAQWEVVPVPYKVQVDGSESVIVHVPFGARVPQHFATQEALREALSLLLIGGVVTGAEKPDFFHGQQGFKRVESFSTEALPQRPRFPAGLDEAASQRAAGGWSQSFVEGFAPLDRAEHERIATLTSSWRTVTGAARDAVRRAEGLWALAAVFPLASLNDAHRAAEIDVADDVAALRGLYPELGALSDAELYARFDWYQSECCYIGGWDANRDDDFLLYLIGSLAPDQREGERAKELGTMAAFAALNGSGVGEAIRFGEAWQRYNSAVCGLELRVSAAMRFMASQQESQGLHGGPVRTLADLFRVGRKTSVSVFPVSQSLTQLAGTSGASEHDAAAR